MFQARVRVSNPRAPARAFEEDFWIDTGAMYTFVPASRLRSIGLDPTGERRVIYAAGREETLPLAYADLEIAGIAERNPCPVIFAPEGALHLLGATALENFGVAPDTSAKRLKPVAAIIGGFLASR